MSTDIPPEVLGEIFYLTRRGPIYTSVAPEKKSLFPWNLGRVCKSWRHAFVTYPKLWAFITLDITLLYRGVAKLEKFCNCFILCLQRSGNHPLSLTLHAREFSDTERLPWIQAWKAFLSCSHRWKNVVLRGGAPQFRNLTTECKGGFPLLQSFTLCPDQQFDLDAFHDAPRLTQCGLIYFGNGRTISHAWSFPLSQLTKFTLATHGFSSDLQVLLENLHSIQELCFKMGGFDYLPSDMSPLPPRCLEHLRVLEVSYHHLEVLRVIKAPSLVELRLETDGLYPVNFYEAVEPFIKLSSCHLRKLVLAALQVDEAEPLIKSFPDLEELYILDDYKERPCYLLGLLDGELGSTALPNLRILTLSKWGCEARCPQDIVAALTSILKFRNGVYIGEPSIPLRPLEKIIIKHRRFGGRYPEPCFLAPIPIPEEFEHAKLEWAPFKVEVQFDQYQESYTTELGW